MEDGGEIKERESNFQREGRGRGNQGEGVKFPEGGQWKREWKSRRGSQISRGRAVEEGVETKERESNFQREGSGRGRGNQEEGFKFPQREGGSRRGSGN